VVHEVDDGIDLVTLPMIALEKLVDVDVKMAADVLSGLKRT
jgi:hypothetical protein